jgi:FdhE protein
LTLDDWIGSHRFLDPLAQVRRRIDAAVERAAPSIPAVSEWDGYVEEFAAGVPLLRSEVPIDLETAGLAVVGVVATLASDMQRSPVAEDAAALSGQLRQVDQPSRTVIDWLLGDDTWQPVRDGLLRSVGWITLSSALRPLVRGFAEWRDEDRWLRRYCPTCGALPAMAQLVGVDPGRRRFLSCGRCASRWRYGRTGCPFCETASHRLLSVGVEGEGGLRIDYCETCRGYLKTYSGQCDEEVLLADWTSLHLDLVARNRGLEPMATSLYDLDTVTRDRGAVFRSASGPSEAESGDHEESVRHAPCCAEDSTERPLL